MLPDGVTRWASRLGRIGEGVLHASRLNIGPRLLLCFACIVLTMLCGGAVVLSEFRVVRVQAERLNDLHQELVAVLRLHSTLLSFHGRLEELAEAEDAGRLAAEAAALRRGVLEETERARIALEQLPAAVRRDPTILPTLEAVRGALPSQLQTMSDLAVLGDWRAVRLRLANQIRPLETMTSALVEKVYADAARDQAHAVENIERVERRVFFIVPATAIATVLIALTLGLLITRSITQPLTRLVEGAEALAHGEFGHQVPIRGRDELAHLGQVFNATTRRLRDLYSALQSSEDRLRLVIDTVPANVWSARPDGALDFVNRRSREQTGLHGEGLLGRGWEAALHPEDRDWFVADWRAALASGEAMEVEARVRQWDGSYRRWLIRNVPLRDASGGIARWYGTGLDIEDRKRVEEEEKRLQAVRAELAHVNRISMLGELAVSLAHELKQPIAAAITSAQTAARWLSRTEPGLQEARDAVQNAVKAGTRAAEIIDRLRALYVRGGPLKREPVCLSDLVQEMLLLLQGEAVRCSVSLRTELAAAERSVVTADRVQLQQVLMNLMLNGIEAMRESGGELLVSSRAGEDGQLTVSVRDSGVGLPPEHAHRIFTAFFTTKPEGSGMGLAISRSIVDEHGGRLWAEPNTDRGATFRFKLPLAGEAGAQDTGRDPR